MPMAQFEVQWGTYVPLIKGAKKSRLGLLILETLFIAGVPKQDIKIIPILLFFIIFVTAYIYIYYIPYLKLMNELN